MSESTDRTREVLRLPWHRETVGHASIYDIAAKVAADLAVPLGEGLPPNTDATWIVNADNKVVAFVGNGPRQTNNADAIIAAVESLATHPSEPPAVTEARRELRDWAQTGLDNWTVKHRATSPESISNACGVNGPTLLSTNARRQSFQAFVDQIDAALAATASPQAASSEAGWAAVTEALTQIIEAYTDGDWQSFGRRIEQAVDALAARPKAASPADQTIALVREAINVRDYPSRTNDEIVALVIDALDPQAALPHYHADGPWGTDEACWESHEAASPGEGEHR